MTCCCCSLPCNNCSKWTWVVEEILAFGTRLRSTHCWEFNYLKLCRPATITSISTILLFFFIKEKLFYDAQYTRLTIYNSCMLLYVRTKKIYNLWFFTKSPSIQIAPTVHNYLTKLSILYLRVGEGERYIDTNFPTSLLYFLLRIVYTGKRIFIHLTSEVYGDLNCENY